MGFLHYVTSLSVQARHCDLVKYYLHSSLRLQLVDPMRTHQRDYMSLQTIKNHESARNHLAYTLSGAPSSITERRSSQVKENGVQSWGAEKWFIAELQAPNEMKATKPDLHRFWLKKKRKREKRIFFFW